MKLENRCPKNIPAVDSLPCMSRRSFFAQTAAVAAGAAFIPSTFAIEEKQVARTVTSVEVCKRYDYPLVRQTLSKMFDEIGGVRSLVKNKHVTVKVNLVNTSKKSVGGIPLSYSVTVHPNVALATGSLFTEYGAKKVTFCDQLPFSELDQAAFDGYEYKYDEFRQTLDGKVDFVNTRNAGAYKKYDLVKVPNGGLIANAWEVHKAYTETDVLVSLGKLKSHVSAGVTFGMKNLFGVPPSSLYGDDLQDEPDENATGYRGRTMHSCESKPLTSVDTFVGETRLGEHGFNVPRFIVDLNAAFPIDLVVVDGVSAIQNAEGWWLGSIVSLATPGLLIAGTNAVCTDSVAAAVMGFNPDADDMTEPFANGSNYLRLARQAGLGENRIAELEVAGIGLEKAKFNYQPTYQRPR